MDFGFTEEQIMMQQLTQKFCEKELDYKYVKWMDEHVDFPPDELWQKFVDMGTFYGSIPTEFGGQGLGQVDIMVAYEQICKRSMSVALAIGVTAGFGVRFINELGTPAQRKISAAHRRGQIQDLHGFDRTCRRDGYSGGNQGHGRRQGRQMGH